MKKFLIILMVFALVLGFAACTNRNNNNNDKDPDNKTPDNTIPDNTNPDNANPDNTNPDNANPDNTNPTPPEEPLPGNGDDNQLDNKDITGIVYSKLSQNGGGSSSAFLLISDQGKHYSVTLDSTAGNENGQAGQGNGQAGQGNDQAGQGNDQTGQGNDQAGKCNDQAGQGNDQTGQGNDQTGQGNDQAGQGNDQTGQGNDQAGQGNGQEGQGNGNANNQNQTNMPNVGDKVTVKVKSGKSNTNGLSNVTASSVTVDKSFSAKTIKADVYKVENIEATSFSNEDTNTGWFFKSFNSYQDSEKFLTENNLKDKVEEHTNNTDFSSISEDFFNKNRLYVFVVQSGGETPQDNGVYLEEETLFLKLQNTNFIEGFFSDIINTAKNAVENINDGLNDIINGEGNDNNNNNNAGNNNAGGQGNEDTNNQKNNAKTTYVAYLIAVENSQAVNNGVIIFENNAAGANNAA